MILLLTEQDILEGTELIKRGKSKQDKLALLLEFIESKKEYFRDLIYISNDCFRNPEKFKQEKILLERRFLNYANSITYEVGLEFADSGSIILSLLTGLVIQSEITPGQTSFDIKKQLIFLKEIKEVPQCDPSSKL